jgi:tripartite ATP-independent transporter DctP family solute receptor
MDRRKFLGIVGGLIASGAVGYGLGSLTTPPKEVIKEVTKEVKVFPYYFDWSKPIYPNVTPDFTMKIGHTDSAEGYIAMKHAQAIIIKNIVERGTKGKMQVKIYPANQLGVEKDVIEQVRIGTTECIITTEGPFAPFYPPIQVYSIPYIFEGNYAIAHEVFNSWFAKELAMDCLKTTGLQTIGIGENSGGFRNFSANKPIRKPEDLKGLKIRTMQIEMHMKMVEALGASPTPIAWGEVYSALKTGVVDGQENPVGVMVWGKLYEVQKYYILDGHVYSANWVFVNANWFNKLPTEYQDLLLSAGALSATVGRGLGDYNVVEQLGFLSAQGMDIYTPSSEELKAWAAITQPACIDWFTKNVSGGQTWVNKLFQAVEEAKKRIYSDRIWA